MKESILVSLKLIAGQSDQIGIKLLNVDQEFGRSLMSDILKLF